MRKKIHKYLPAHFHDPVGLALRLLKSRDPAACFAMASAAAGILCAPLDMLLTPFEQSCYRQQATTQHPLLIVCGPPRSGTTLVYQTLVQHLPVAYFPNLTALFPRSPLTAMRLFGRLLRRPTAEYRSFYGKTRSLSGTNDALYLWDRWLGSDRTRPARQLTQNQRDQMRQFFAACRHVFDQPLVNKNNNLNVSAHLVAEAVEQVHFICLTRDRRELAQSLYRARCEIHGSPSVPYGLTAASVEQAHRAAIDPVQSVCDQVAFFDQVHQQQQQRLGEDRFWIVSYEDFCRRPGDLVQRVARKILHHPAGVRGPLPAAFQRSQKKKVSDDVAARIDALLDKTSAPAVRLNFVPERS